MILGSSSRTGSLAETVYHIIPKKSNSRRADTSKLERGDLLKCYQAYQIALQSHFMQPDEVRYEEDMKPLGLDFIQLGLNDVLYFPDKGEIYTPNTNQTVTVEGRSWESQDRDNLGRWTSNGGGVMHSPDRGGGIGGGSGLTNDSESGKISAKQEKNRKELQDAISSGKVKTKLNKRNQSAHKLNSEEYNKRIAKGLNPSYTELSHMEVQKIINEYSCTGTVHQSEPGHFKEVVELDYEFGVYVNEDTGEHIPTKRGTIHYSKNGTHLVPASPT